MKKKIIQDKERTVCFLEAYILVSIEHFDLKKALGSKWSSILSAWNILVSFMFSSNVSISISLFSAMKNIIIQDWDKVKFSALRYTKSPLYYMWRGTTNVWITWSVQSYLKLSEYMYFTFLIQFKHFSRKTLFIF